MAKKLTAKQDKPKVKRGRPSKFIALDLDQVKKVAEKGWTDIEMADFFGVVESTWYKWKVDFPDFSEVLRSWKTFADENVERSLYERATGYSHSEDKIFNDNGDPLIVPTVKHYPPDPTSMIFWLKNRDQKRWRDKQDVEHTGKDGGPILLWGQKKDK
jgi:hypothetical protein